MPTYEFIRFGDKGEELEIIERIYLMSKCPAKIRVKGRVFKRAAFSRSNTTALNEGQINATVNGYPRIDTTLPLGDVGGGTDSYGRPIIKSQAHEQELIRSSEGRMRRD